MDEDKLYTVSIIAIIAIVAIVGSVYFLRPNITGQDESITGFATYKNAQQGDQKESSLPDAVKEAIKNRQESVEIQVSPAVSRVFFIDYVGRSHATPSGTDCGPDSRSFKKIGKGKGLRWFSFPVAYQIDASGSGIDQVLAKQAVVNAFNTWDAEEHPRESLFTEASPHNVFVNWAFLDGGGGTLAVASVTYYVRSGQIISGSVTYDSGDSWTVYSGLSCSSQGSAFDIEDIGAHEIGHVIGLGHVSSSMDVAQTMYPYASNGETLKRTLGTGDKRGIDFLY